MKWKNKKIDIIDYNRNIIKKKINNSLYILSDLEKILLSIPQYQSLHKKKRKKK